jgi:predicted NUDIX family phosphoesterase
MEFVYVVRRRDLFESDSPQGFHRAISEAATSTASASAGFLEAARTKGFFVERRHAERDASLKQIIPYCVMVDAESLDADPLVLRLRRLAKQGEARLHDKLSIGIGGHLNPVDAGVVNYESDDAAREAKASVLDKGVLRELNEELTLRWMDGAPSAPVPLGFLNDDSTPVGSVHFGVVFAVSVSPSTAIRETDRMTGEWAAWSRMRQEAAAGANYETWSAILLRSLTTEDFNAAAHRRVLTRERRVRAAAAEEAR